MATAVPSNFNLDLASFGGQARIENGMGHAPVGDALDELLDYNAGMDDILREVDNNIPSLSSEGRPGRSNASGAEDILGIDEEIQITRKPRINVKLDENRLLSQAGIPKLRRISKKRLRFKGKGHEYGDVARLLSVYQLWLDDLYPKAKFADALAITEKLGHTKRLHMMRREWIEEGKPRSTVEDNSTGNAPVSNGTEQLQASSDGDGPPLSGPGHGEERPRTPLAIFDNDEEDLYDATPRTRRIAAPVEGAWTETPDDWDELDALLAEENAVPTPAGNTTATISKVAGDDFGDEEDAMAGFW